LRHPRLQHNKAPTATRTVPTASTIVIEDAPVLEVCLIVHEAPQLLDELPDGAVHLFAGLEKQVGNVVRTTHRSSP
jgi:hypothetical protein